MSNRSAMRGRLVMRICRHYHGSRCAECGESRVNLLEFHHHTGEKNFSIGRHVTSRAFEDWSLLLAELELVVLLCPTCHMGCHRPPEGPVMTEELVRAISALRPEPALAVRRSRGSGSRSCRTCGKTKRIASFEPHGKHYRQDCRSCLRVAVKRCSRCGMGYTGVTHKGCPWLRSMPKGFGLK